MLTESSDKWAAPARVGAVSPVCVGTMDQEQEVRTITKTSHPTRRRRLQFSDMVSLHIYQTDCSYKHNVQRKSELWYTKPELALLKHAVHVAVTKQTPHDVDEDTDSWRGLERYCNNHERAAAIQKCVHRILRLQYDYHTLLGIPGQNGYRIMSLQMSLSDVKRCLETATTDAQHANRIYKETFDIRRPSSSSSRPLRRK